MEELLGNLTLEKFNLKYYKIKNKNKFGVKIIREENFREEYAEVREITEDEKMIERFINKLAAGIVTPVTLKYIIEDCMIEHIRDNFREK